MSLDKGPSTTSIPIGAPGKRPIYVGIGLLLTLMALVGFWPTYFGPLVQGTVDRPPLVHVHAVVYMGWLCLFIAQAALASTGRVRLHRKLGRIAIAYGIGVIVVGVLTAFGQFSRFIEAGQVEVAQRRLLGPLTDMVAFPVFFALAVGYRRRPEIHKRFMLVATTTLLIAAVSRMPFLGTPAPLWVFLPVWFAPILLAMAYDFMTKRLIHPAYVIGLGGLFLLRLRGNLVETDAWLGFSGWLAAFVD